MGFRRGTLTAAALAALSLCACTAQASHPRALGSASAPASPSPLASPAGAASVSPSDAASPASPSVTAASPSASVSPTGTPSSTATLSPGALSSADIATGVRATANEFFADLNIAFATGDVTKYNALTSPGCVCRGIAKTLQDTYAKNQRIVGVSTTVTSIAVVSFVAGGASADVHYTISAGRIIDANGSQVNTSIAQPDAHDLLFIENLAGKWIVYQNTRLK